MERRKGRREDGVGLQWNHGKGGGREDEGDESGAMKRREGGRRKGWGWEWSHGKKGRRKKEGEGGRVESWKEGREGEGRVIVESWKEGREGAGRELRVESTILYMSPHRGDKLL